MLTNQGLIGQQGGPGHPIDNKWLGNFGQAEAWTELGSNLNSTQNRLYLKQGGIFNPSPNNGLLPSLPFSLIFTTGASTQCPASPIRLSQKENLEKIALDSITFVNLPVESKFFAKQHLHQKLTSDPSLSATSQILQNCFPALCISGIGQVANVETEIGQDDFLQSWMLNQQLDGQAPVEGKHQELNRMLLEYFAGWSNTMDSTDLTRLLALAHECPYEGGQAVYQARTLVELVYPGEHYDDDCMLTYNPSGNRMGQTENLPLAERNFSIFPNPSAGTFIVQGSSNGQGSIEILDLAGRVVKVMQIESGEFEETLQLNEESDGIYFVRIVDQSGFVWTSKLLLQRR